MSSKARGLADLGNAFKDGALSNRNLIINGAMQVAQRGASVLKTGTGAAFGSLDRYRIWQNLAGVEVTLEQSIDAPEGFHYSQKWTTTTSGTPSSSNFMGIGQVLEVLDVYRALWSGASHVTTSFWVKSSIVGTFAFNLNPAQTNSGGSSNRVLYHTTYTINVANTWEHKSIRVPLAGLASYALMAGYNPVSTGLEVSWVLDVGSGDRDQASLGWNNPLVESRNMVTSVASGTGFYTTTGATFQITGVQLEVGDTATPFEHRSYGDELARCMRYYEVFHPGSQSGYLAIGNWWTSNQARCLLQYTEKRTNPSISASDVICYQSGSGTQYALSETIDDAHSTHALLYGGVPGASTTQGHSLQMLVGANGSIQIDAEL